jgi:hypothetical protein
MSESEAAEPLLFVDKKRCLGEDRCSEGPSPELRPSPDEENLRGPRGLVEVEGGFRGREPFWGDVR